MFGGFRLDAESGILTFNGQRVSISPKVFDTFLVLLSAGGGIVTKEKIIAQVWDGAFVSESGVTRNVSLLRKALSDLDPGTEYVETIPKRGYRFKGTVTSALAGVMPSAIGPASDAEEDTQNPPGQWRVRTALAILATLMAAGFVWILVAIETR